MPSLSIIRRVVPEASLERTEHGLAPRGEGWFVLDAREARWRRRPERGFSLPFTGWSDEEAETLFPQLGVALYALAPGEPVGMYHWEADQEDFLVLAGEALLLVEGEERPLREWDFVHCPPGTKHVILGAGEGGCVLLAAGAREHVDEPCNGGGYVADETARRHGASVEEDTADADVAYARFPESEPTPYGGWLPGG
ncbi:MAG TPA: cupin domain-containing protein [Gaiellaceae bacterium]|nr:cupin domain-containing protein [Gaiellaceae bacterium]